MIGYKAHAKLKKKKAGLKTMAFSLSSRKVRKFQLEILPTNPKHLDFIAVPKSQERCPGKNLCTN